MQKLQSRSIRLLLTLLLCLLLTLTLTLPALAQSTPEPTFEPTPDATAEAPTPAPVETPVAPVIAGPDPVIYASTFDKVIDLLIAIVIAGGGVAAIKAFRDPERGKQYVTFGIELLQMAAKFTPTPNDDAALARLMTEWQKVIAPMVAESVKAVIADAKTELRAERDAKTANATMFRVPPPQNSVDD